MSSVRKFINTITIKPQFKIYIQALNKSNMKDWFITYY